MVINSHKFSTPLVCMVVGGTPIILSAERKSIYKKPKNLQNQRVGALNKCLYNKLAKETGYITS